MNLGTRGSALALAQTALTLQALRAAWPGGRFEIREIRTTGDKRQDLSLTHLAPGGHGYDAAATVDGSAAVSSPPLVGKVDPGLFTRELEAELLAGTISVAVHSLKDLPTEMPAGLKLAAVLPRAETADVLIWKAGASAAPRSVLPPLPAGAWIATSSLRRERQLLHARPDLRTCEVRGNVGTRLRKLHDHPEWTGTVLALAGLERLGYRLDRENDSLETDDGLRFRATILGPDAMLPAVGQGAIGLQARGDDADTLRALAAINHAPHLGGGDRRTRAAAFARWRLPVAVGRGDEPRHGACGTASAHGVVLHGAGRTAAFRRRRRSARCAGGRRGRMCTQTGICVTS